MSYTIPIAGVAVVAVLAGVLYTTTKNSNAPIDTNAAIDDALTAQPIESELAETPSNELTTQTVDVVEENNDNALPITTVSEPPADAIADVNPTSLSSAIEFAQSIAHERLDNAAIEEYANTLRNDPAKLSAVLDDFAAEADPERLSRLRLLLGQLDDPSMVSVAESMLFSGNPDSSNEALKLLRDIGPRVPAAQEVGVNVLTSTQDPQLLVGATNILTSSASADAETTQRVVSSLTSLVQHPDAGVRRASFSTLARWSKDPADASILVQGLDDTDPKVRRSTAYGFVGYPHADASVISALLNTAENPAEARSARSGAILALKGMPLDESQKARLQAAQSQR